MPDNALLAVLLGVVTTVVSIAVLAAPLALATGAVLVPLAPTVRDEQLSYARCWRLMFNAHVAGLVLGVAVMLFYAIALPLLMMSEEMRSQVRAATDEGSGPAVLAMIISDPLTHIILYATASFVSVAVLLRSLRPNTIAGLVRGLSAAVFVTALGHAAMFFGLLALGVVLMMLAAGTTGDEMPFSTP